MNIDKLLKKKQHAKHNNNLRQLAEITNTLGDTYFERNRPKEALREYMEQLRCCEELQDKLSCAIAHRMIGEVYASMGNYEQALTHQNLHLEGAKEMKNSIEEQRAFATLGRTHFCSAESLTGKKRNEALENAKKAYTQSMELCDKLTTEIKLEEKTLMRARLLLNLGLTLEAQGETRQAISLIEQATALCVSNNFQEDLHRTCISLATIYERQNDLELALSYIETAATVNDVCLKAEAKLTKAELFMRTGQWIKTREILVSLYRSSGLPKDVNQQVEKYLRIIVTICRAENSLLDEPDVQSKQKLYETLGDAAVAVRCFDKGVEYYRHMLTCAEETGEQIGISLISLAQTLKDAGRCKEALPFAQSELDLCISPRERCRSALFLADLLAATDAADTEIRRYYILALSSANESDVKLQRSVARELVNYLESIGQFDEAETTRQKAGLTEASNDTESEVSSDEESDAIGADICLEDLSDLEEAEESDVKATVTSTRKRRRRGTAVITRNAKGETDLHVACINGNIAAVERLLSSGHSTNVRDNLGWTPLHEAANFGHVEIAELLLKYGAEINDPGGISCYGMTPLHDAASCGHSSMIELLMRHGADVTRTTRSGDTVLDCLEDWRERVNLSPEDLVEYDAIRKKLLAVIPARKRRKRFSDDASTLDKKSASSFETEPEVSAGEDYKRTIARLRSFNKNSTKNTVKAFKASNNDTPLVSEEQVLVDDWLEDDIGITTTKKKSTSQTNQNKSSSHHAATIKRKSSEGNLENIAKKLKLNDARRSKDDFSTSENSDEDSAEICQYEGPKRTRRKRQTSLISNGFTVSRSPSPVPYLQPQLPHTTVSSKQHDKEYVHLRMSVKEEVFDLKMAICEDERDFITCIISTTERMFHDETGCTIKLQLQSMNGTAITKEGILKNARENANDATKLECEVVELQVPSIVERYKTICCSRNLIPCEIVLKCLRSCENTSIFRVKADDIDDKQLLIPLLKTLEYEKSIKLLQLSGTVLLTAGTHLHRCLSNLTSLQELYLKGCDIDFACLRQVNSLPPQLRVLDLSYNPLGAEGRDTLRKLIAPLRYLQTLNLRYCMLEDFHLPLDNPNLTSCDISWNKLNRDATASFLSRQLFDLNLSNILPSNRSVLSLDTMTLSPSLESLDLSFCDVTDFDVKIILKQLPRLLKLILSGNTNVSVLSVNALLSRQPTLNYIDVSGCKNIASHPEAKLFIQNPEICTLLASIEPNLCNSWIKLWRGAGIITKLPHNLAIFKPV
ncbi:tonsoku-like protein [Monomorium pharaonis]|uniref:tonsoku-like protein n=1 Tax=Monomorium pharaonis TaxID=307658 RepID=UPI00174770C9|nr:tonsoku-like protein [Monomorium pharaonis]